jgi:hypothetical protein
VTNVNVKETTLAVFASGAKQSSPVPGIWIASSRCSSQRRRQLFGTSRAYS